MVPPPDIDIHPYTQDDYLGCVAIFDSNVPEFFAPSEREGFAHFLSSLPGPFWVVRDRPAGTIVGCGGLSIADGGTTAWLRWGMVLAGRQRQGIGRRLIDARLQWLDAQPGIKSVRVATTAQVSGFFQHMGFERTTTAKDKYGPGLDRCDLERRIV
ncbi:MAG: GNAT family N-acetyltransferase [Thermomicrobiales bacterium]|nr:GNAT family N-acetyltransferase [Thermomicrobiales bacterium]MCO5220431.1 GNAT family N-acetyltransferase [Thermomicrobiales bacterium]